MALDRSIRNNWIEIQKKHDYPVNAIGMRIDPADRVTMGVWRAEGLEVFVNKPIGR